MKIKKKITFLLTSLMVLCFSVTAYASPIAFDQKVISRISVKRMMKTLEDLSVNLGPKVASSPEERQAAQYIAREFEGYKYDVQVQEFTYENNVGYLKMLKPEIKDLHIQVNKGTVITSEDGVTGEIVNCGFGAKEEFTDKVKGNIALVKASQKTTAMYKSILVNAEEAGAKAVIIQNDDWRRLSISSTVISTIPYATLNKDAGEMLEEGSVVNLKINRYNTSQNVIATRKPHKNQDNGNIVVVSAHYDSVPTAPGANDNITGVAAMLELARIFSSFPIDTEIRFVACGSEEVGLLGSAYYVSTLSEDEKTRIIANFNMDMVGTAGEKQTTLYVNVNDGEDNLVARTAREVAQRLGYGEVIKAPFKRGASDHVSFWAAGIDAGNFIWRDPVTADLEPWYHQPYDTIDRISEERFRTATEIVGASVYELIRKDNPSLQKAKIQKQMLEEYLKNEEVIIE
ncbi:aminopeptidase YwaD [Clostridium malenominatum]|uniref:Aminopeptidase YwaD n=1 Tax=Clostridium malenominatum TaxID=1539 RepID=A0ABP3UBL7_9CLOT